MAAFAPGLDRNAFSINNGKQKQQTSTLQPAILNSVKDNISAGSHIFGNTSTILSATVSAAAAQQQQTVNYQTIFFNTRTLPCFQSWHLHFPLISYCQSFRYLTQVMLLRYRWAFFYICLLCAGKVTQSPHHYMKTLANHIFIISNSCFISISIFCKIIYHRIGQKGCRSFWSWKKNRKKPEKKCPSPKAKKIRRRIILKKELTDNELDEITGGKNLLNTGKSL